LLSSWYKPTLYIYSYINAIYMFFIFSLKVIPQGHLTAKGSLGFATLSITFFIEWPIMVNCGGLKSYNLPYLCLGVDIELARLGIARSCSF